MSNRIEEGATVMQYMVVEKFKADAARAIYERAQLQGRMLPQGLLYLDSWVSVDLGMCFQLMECDDAALFEEWTSRWDDLTEFEIIPVISSAQASTMVFGDRATDKGRDTEPRS